VYGKSKGCRTELCVCKFSALCDGRLLKIALAIISGGWGGTEAVVYDLAEHLREKGQHVCVLASREMLPFYRKLDVELFDIGPCHYFKSWAASKVRASSKYDLPRRIIYLICAYLDEIRFLILYKKTQSQVRHFVLEKNVSVVHSHQLDSAFLCSCLRQTGVSLLVTVHGEHDLLLPGRRRVTILSHAPPIKLTRFSILMTPIVKLREYKFRKALLDADLVTTVSVFDSRNLRAWQPSLKARIVVVPNGVDFAEIRHETMRTVRLKGDFNIIFPGGAKLRKGGVHLILALAKLKNAVPNIHAYFTGHVPEDHPLRNIASKMELTQTITFTGFLTTQEYRTLLKSVDLLVMPSVEEAFGLVYLEGMALGKPIVALRKGAVGEIVHGGRNGILVDLDAEQIATAVLQIRRNENLRKIMTRNNLQDSKKLDWGRVVEKYLEIYNELKPGQ
jgi:glycosyltransferase involved in cell wall biosynthesis